MSKELTESRRTRYTRRAMQDALIELLRDQPLGSITVKALCEQADVNRSTFYAHYASIEELLHDIEDETMAWVTTALEQLLAQPDPAGIEHVIERICQYIADNRNHLRADEPESGYRLPAAAAGIDLQPARCRRTVAIFGGLPSRGADAYAIRRVRQHWAFAILARHRSRGLS